MQKLLFKSVCCWEGEVGIVALYCGMEIWKTTSEKRKKTENIQKSKNQIQKESHKKKHKGSTSVKHVHTLFCECDRIL